MNFNLNIESLKQEYLDIFEGVISDVMYTVQCDENRNIGTTNLGMSKMRRQDELKS